MSICGAMNYKTKTRCTRSKAHIANGMQHADNNGNKWALNPADLPTTHMTPTAELRARVTKAYRRRLERTERLPAELLIFRAQNYVVDAIEALVKEYNLLRSEHAQEPLKVDISWHRDTK